MTEVHVATATRPEQLVLDRMATPVGPLLLVTDEGGVLRALAFGDDEEGTRRILRRQYGGGIAPEPGDAPAPIRAALDAYFAGELTAFDGIAWGTGGTPFQRAVWGALAEIPAGTTTSYGALAAKIGSPKAVRAVGLANGANPIAIVLPCHRVIGSNGTLTGYGGGLERKRWLLAHEGVMLGLGDDRM